MIQFQCNCQERGKDKMRKEDVISYKIDTSVLKNYVESINSIKEPMIQIKAQLNQLTKLTQEQSKSINESIKPFIETSKVAFKSLNQLTKPMQKELKSINNMSNVIKKLLIKYPNEQAKIFTDTIKQKWIQITECFLQE